MLYKRLDLSRFTSTVPRRSWRLALCSTRSLSTAASRTTSRPRSKVLFDIIDVLHFRTRWTIFQVYWSHSKRIRFSPFPDLRLFSLVLPIKNLPIASSIVMYFSAKFYRFSFSFNFVWLSLIRTRRVLQNAIEFHWIFTVLLERELEST